MDTAQLEAALAEQAATIEKLSELRFHCLPQGTKIAVVLELRDGYRTLSYLSKSVIISSDQITFPLSDFSSGMPPGFSPEKARRQPRTRRVTKTLDEPDVVAQVDGQVPMTSESFTPPQGEDLPGSDNFPETALKSEPLPQPGAARIVRSQSSARKIDCVSSSDLGAPSHIKKINLQRHYDIPTSDDDVEVTIKQQSRCGVVELYINLRYAGEIDTTWRGYLKPGGYEISFREKKIHTYRDHIDIPEGLASGDKAHPFYSLTIPWGPVLYDEDYHSE